MAYQTNNIKKAWVVDSSEYFRRLESEYIAKATKSCDIESLPPKIALQRFADGKYPDVLIIDVLQPNINGVELVNRLKTQKPEMNIVICSAEAKQNSKSLIGMTLINKPIMSLPLFMDTMKDVIENI